LLPPLCGVHDNPGKSMKQMEAKNRSIPRLASSLFGSLLDVDDHRLDALPLPTVQNYSSCIFSPPPEQTRVHGL